MTKEEIPKITKLCSAINQLVLDLEEKVKTHEKEIKSLKEEVSKDRKAIDSLRYHLETYYTPSKKGKALYMEDQ